MTGKVELGQGARAELTQAAAEELRVAPEQVRLIMADTGLVANEGVTAGSGTTPRTVPSVRKAAAAARELLIGLACKRWQVAPNAVEVKNGILTHAETKRTISYADLARAEDLAKTLAQAIPAGISLTPLQQWKVLGTSLPRPNRRDLVTGAHRHPSDIVCPGMLYGKVLRPPSYGATLTGIDLSPAKAMPGVTVLRDESFIGCAAATSFQAEQALAAIAKTATWTTTPHPSARNCSRISKSMPRRAEVAAKAGRVPPKDRPKRRWRGPRQSSAKATKSRISSTLPWRPGRAWPSGGMES